MVSPHLQLVILCRFLGPLGIQLPAYTVSLPQVSNNAGVASAKFQTTETFTTTHGFVIPSSQSNASGSPLATAEQGGLNGSVSRVDEHPSTPVGWSGLLEISRCAGSVSISPDLAALKSFQ